MLDSGGFGAVTLTRSITINGAGTRAAITGVGATSININIIDPNDTRRAVWIVNLDINGMGSGVNGIRILPGNLAGTW